MKTGALEPPPLPRSKRITALRVFLVFLGLWILLKIIASFVGPVWGEWAGLFGLLAFLSGTWVALSVLPRLIRRSIWSLRNRLLVTYIFIAVVPIALILALVAIGGYIVAGQTGMYLVSSELERSMGTLNLPARVLAMNPPAGHQGLFDQVAPFIKQRFSEFEMVEQIDGRLLRYPNTSTLEPSNPELPDYTGIVVRNGYYYCWSHIKKDKFVVDVLAPLHREWLGSLIPRLGAVDLKDLPGESRAQLFNRKRGGKPAVDAEGIELGAVPPPANRFDIEVSWFMPISVADWNHGTRADSAPHVLLLSTRPSALLAAVFGEKFNVAQALLFTFYGIAILFLIVELVAAVIGTSLTLSITNAIHNLYEGTRRVAAGDFSSRIRVKGKDQLAAVSSSFNAMTERIEQLIVVEKEKERLQSELEIAREVQSQLFPRSNPTMRTLEITGVCRPARMVSGDYYDFLCLHETSLAMAIGDVAGKGISAALLMASIQSIMRTQLTGAPSVMAAAANGEPRLNYSTSKMVSQLNKQLYANTSPEKYATFLFGIFDEGESTLTYTNAGHLPPILIRRGEPQMLEVTGTVVGAFPMSRYEEQTVALERGDLLVSYTDGITEPENEYGEEFGAERLIETLVRNQNLAANELVTRVMDAVRQWTSAPELPDDMTLVLARRI